jgi:hypothetical protein
MCLEISTKYHGNPKKPLIAEEDIEVVKYLKKPCIVAYSSVDFATGKSIKKWREEVLCTPFMNEPIEFDENGECILKSGTIIPVFESCINAYIVEVGIHAYRKEMDSLSLQFTPPCTPFRAYIPKGTKYYIGENDDIVAEKMVIKNEIYENICV